MMHGQKNISCTSVENKRTHFNTIDAY